MRTWLVDVGPWLVAVAIAMVVVGCTDRERARLSAYGQPCAIELWSGGRVVATFESTGKVHCTEGGICEFMDARSRKLVQTTGDIVVRVK